MIDLQIQAPPQETTRIQGRTEDLHIKMNKRVQTGMTYRTTGYIDNLAR
jgi:hypothetical protein